MAQEKPVSKDVKAELSGKKVKITIHKDPRPHAVDPVPVSINGYQWTIRRGEIVEVPIEVVHVLNNAVEVHYDQIANPDHTVNLRPREAMAYPFAVV